MEDVLSRGQLKLLMCALRLAQGEHLMIQKQRHCIFFLMTLPLNWININEPCLLNACNKVVLKSLLRPSRKASSKRCKWEKENCSKWILVRSPNCNHKNNPIGLRIGLRLKQCYFDRTLVWFPFTV